MMQNESLMAMFRMNFLLTYHLKYSLEELENMYPYEREVLVMLVDQELEKAKNRKQQRLNT